MRAGIAMMIHHVSAVVAFSIYLQGGVGHGLTLYAVLCELTNPFLAMRYEPQVTSHKSRVTSCKSQVTRRMGGQSPSLAVR